MICVKRIHFAQKQYCIAFNNFYCKSLQFFFYKTSLFKQVCGCEKNKYSSKKDVARELERKMI